MIAFICANYSQVKAWKKAVLFVMTFVFLLIGIIVKRVTFLALFSKGHERLASGLWHDLEGTLFVAVILFVSLHFTNRFLNRLGESKQPLEPWKNRLARVKQFWLE